MCLVDTEREYGLGSMDGWMDGWRTCMDPMDAHQSLLDGRQRSKSVTFSVYAEGHWPNTCSVQNFQPLRLISLRGFAPFPTEYQGFCY